MHQQSRPELPELTASRLETNGVRHAALLLYAMAPSDRAWVLNALSPFERDSLLVLLAELEALGVARDPGLIDQITRDGPYETSSNDASALGHGRRSEKADEDWLRALDGAQLAMLVRCLRAEPVGLIAEFLLLAAWSWRDEVLSGLGPEPRRRVEASMSSLSQRGPSPPGVRSALMALVATRLHAATAMPPTSPQRSWQLLKRRFAWGWRTETFRTGMER